MEERRDHHAAEGGEKEAMDDPEASPTSNDGEDIDAEPSDEEPQTGEDGRTKAPARKGKARLNYLASHKVIEKKRRDRINNALSKLGQIVPDCAQFASKKLDKALTLENTISYIERIQQGGIPALIKPHGFSTRQVVGSVSHWVAESWRSYGSTEHFAQELLQRLQGIADEEAASGAVPVVKRETHDGTQMPAPPLLLGVGTTAVLPPVLPLQSGGGGARFDGRSQPQLLPVVPPPQGALNTATLFSAAQLRPPSSEGVNFENPMLWSQHILQQNIIHQQNAAAYSSYLNTSSPAPIPIAHPYMPSVTAGGGVGPLAVDAAHYSQHEQHQKQQTRTASSSSGGNNVQMWQPEHPSLHRGSGGQVTFNSATVGGAGAAGDDGEAGAPRPKRLNLGLSIAASAVATPSAFSTVSTPRGANTPGADEHVLQSPGVVVGDKSFPFGAAGSTPNRSYRQKAAVPSSLNLEPSGLPPPPDFGNTAVTTAITPGRQSLANSLLELSGQAPFSGSAGMIPGGGGGGAGFKPSSGILSSANTSVEDALSALPGDPHLLLNAQSFSEQLMQQFSPRLQETMQSRLQLPLAGAAAKAAATLPGDFDSTAVTTAVEPETPAGMPLLTADKRAIPLTQHLDSAAASVDDGDWVKHRHPATGDEDKPAGGGGGGVGGGGSRGEVMGRQR